MKKSFNITYGGFWGQRGHNAAARNLRDALELISDEVKVEVLDLFESSYGSFNTMVKSAYLGVVQYTPKLWGGIYSLLDNSTFLENRMAGFTRLKNALGDIVHETQPDCVVSTYPVYAHVIQELYRDHSERPFRFITVITDSITVNSTWFRAPSDLYCVPNEATGAVLKAAGIPESQIKALGFPVSHLFTEAPAVPVNAPAFGEQRRILYVINTGKKKAGKVIDRLLEIPDTQLTITVGRDAELKSKLLEQTQSYADRVKVLGWTNQMPQLMLGSHLVIGKAGGASVQEAIAARCPMIVNQIIPGQEEGNARLISESTVWARSGGTKTGRCRTLVKDAFAHKARL